MVTSCFQAVILCLFNKYEELSYNKVKELTAIPEAELNNCFRQLCNPKQKILSKEISKNPKFQPDEKVKVNTTFSNNNFKINFIPNQTYQKMEDKKTKKEEQEEKIIRYERLNIIDSVIIRVMKAKKSEKYD